MVGFKVEISTSSMDILDGIHEFNLKIMFHKISFSFGFSSCNSTFSTYLDDTSTDTLKLPAVISAITIENTHDKKGKV